MFEEIQREVAACVRRHIIHDRINIFLASTQNCRAFVLAYVLARQDTGCKRSAANTTTPPDAMSRGVFRVSLLTPMPNICHIWALEGHFPRKILTSEI